MSLPRILHRLPLPVRRSSGSRQRPGRLTHLWSRGGLIVIGLATAAAFGCGDEVTEPGESGAAPQAPATPGAGGVVPGTSRTGAASLASATAENGATTLATDKDDYQPGEHVVVTGTGWEPGETVLLEFLERPTLHAPDTLMVVVSEQGDFRDDSYVIQNHHLGQGFQLTAWGLSSGLMLQVEFTDATFIVSPSNGAAGGGTVVTFSIPSPPFSSTATYTVQFGTAAPRPAAYVSATRTLQVTTPAGPPGAAVDVTIFEDGVNWGSRASGYFYWGPPTGIAFSTTGFTGQTGACRSLTVRLKDVNGFSVPAPGEVQVDLTSTSSTGRFYSNSTCTTQITGTTIAAGATSSPQWWYKDDTIGRWTLTATTASWTQAAATANIIGAATTFSFSFGEFLQAGSCVVVFLETRDEAGNSSPLGATTSVTLSSSDGGTFYSTRSNTGECTTQVSSVTLPQGTTSRTLFFRGVTAGSVGLTGSAAGMTPGTTVLDFAKAASALRFSSTLTTQPGACLAISVSVRNEDGGPAQIPTTRTVTMTSSSATGQFFEGSTCATPVTSLEVGFRANSLSLSYRDPTPGSPTLTVSSTGLDPATGVATIGSPTQSTTTTAALTPSPSTYGTQVGGTVTVTGASTAPTGTVRLVQGTSCASGVPTLSGPATLSATGSKMAAASLPAVATLSTSATPHVLTACYAGATGFAASQSAALNHLVNPAPLTIRANDVQKVYGDPLPAFSAAYSGFVGGETKQEVFGAAEPTFQTAATLASSVKQGGYPVTPGGLTAANYAITYQPGTLTITPAPLTVTADPAQMEYGDPLPAFTLSYSAFKVGGETPAAVFGAGLPTVTTDATQQSAVRTGGYVLTASGPATTPNYTVTYRSGTLTITPAPITITADNKTMFYGAPQPPPFTATYAGFKLGETPQTAGVLSGSLSFSGAAAAVGATTPVNPSILNPGLAPYDIVPGGLTVNANYALTYKPGVLTVKYNDAVQHVLLQPINTSPTPGAPSPQSSFKLGSTVPVKFQILSGAGSRTPVSVVRATIKVTQKDPNADVPIDETVVTTPADVGTSFRYDAAAGQYVFNFGTKNLQAGTYSVWAQLDDGSTIPAIFDLRTK